MKPVTPQTGEPQETRTSMNHRYRLILQHLSLFRWRHATLIGWYLTALLLHFSAPTFVSATPPSAPTPCPGKVLLLNQPVFQPLAVHANGSPPIAGLLFGADVNGDGTAGLLILSVEQRQIQLAAFDRPSATFTFTAPRSLPEDCPLEAAVVADVAGLGHDEVVAIHAGMPHLWHIPLDRSERPLRCFPWGNIPPGQTLKEVHAARRFHRKPDAILGIANDDTRLIWEFRSNPQVFLVPRFPEWDVRTVLGAVALPPEGEVGTLVCRIPGSLCAIQTPGLMSYLPSWYDLPGGGTQYRAPLIGDFDGDRQTDTVTTETQLGGWWVAFGEGNSAVERTARGLPTRLAPDARITVVDVDGDSLSDIVVLPGGGQQLEVFLSRVSQPLADVELQGSDGVTVTRSDSAGRIAVPESATMPLRPQKVGYDFSPALIQPTNRCPVIRAEQHPGPEVAVNRAFRRGGDDDGPYVCTGYNLGSQTRWGEILDSCPRGYAVVGTQDMAGSWPTVAALPISSTCCRLPKADMLTEEVVLASTECPDGTFAIGAEQNYFCNDCPKLLRCARLNSDRYTLGPPQPGGYWGIGRNIRWMTRRLDRRDMPAALRYGLGRMSERTWDPDGCVGQPFGSVLTRKAQLCDHEEYRQILYKGLPGDPPAGTPVNYFPSCESLSDVFDPLAGCVRGQGERVSKLPSAEEPAAPAK